MLRIIISLNIPSEYHFTRYRHSVNVTLISNDARDSCTWYKIHS